MAEAFLEAGEQRLFVARFDVDDPIRVKACLVDRRREQVGAGYAPKDAAWQPSDDPSREYRRRRAVYRAGAAPSDFVQGAKREAATR